MNYERIKYYLQAYLDANREYISQEEIDELKQLIAEVSDGH